jgi:ribosomal protein S18 acetylase RimI-like enzyme
MALPTDALAERELANVLDLTAAATRVSAEGWFERDGPLAWFWSAVPIALLNQVVACGPDVPVSTLERAVAALRATGDPFSARIRAGRDDALAVHLERLGLHEERSESFPGMALAPLDARALRGQEDAHDLDLRAIVDLDGLAAHHELLAEGFEMPLEIARRLVPPVALGLESFTILVGFVDGVPATTASAWTAGDTVGVYNVASRATHRRRGLGSAATRAAILDGADRGATVATLQSTPAGHGLYASLGFREVMRYRTFVAA